MVDRRKSVRWIGDPPRLRLSTQHREQFAGAEARTRESGANVQHNLAIQRENCAISWQGARQCAKSWAATVNLVIEVLAYVYSQMTH